MAYGGVEQEEIRIILIGRTGDGKSSTGNTILGEEVFKVSGLSRSQTKKCDFQEGICFGRRFVVVDTPGFYDTELTHEEILRELLRAVVYSSPGFHAIGFVLRPGRFTKELQQTLELFQKWFGEGVKKYALLILTDTNSKEEADGYFHDASRELITLRNWCGNIVLPFQNIRPSKELKKQQVSALLDVINQIKLNNNGTHFKHIAYSVAEWYAGAKSAPQVSYDSLCLFRKAGIDKKSLTVKYKLNLGSILVNGDEAEEAEKCSIEIPSTQLGTSSDSRSGNIRIIDDCENPDGSIFRKEDPPPDSRRERERMQGLGHGSDAYGLHGPANVDVLYTRSSAQKCTQVYSADYFSYAVDETLSSFEIVVESELDIEKRTDKPKDTDEPEELQEFASKSSRHDGGVIDRNNIFDRFSSQNTSTSYPSSGPNRQQRRSSHANRRRSDQSSQQSHISSGCSRPVGERTPLVNNNRSFRDECRNDESRFSGFFGFFVRIWQRIKRWFSGSSTDGPNYVNV